LENWPLPDPTVLESLTPPSDDDDATLRASLAPLALGARAHAIDASIVSAGSASSAAETVAIALEQGTTYVTRQHGCDPDESAAVLLKSGTFVQPQDPRPTFAASRSGS